MTSEIDLILQLQKLEPTFVEAGKIAYEMQKTAKSYNKTDTGNPASDIVTEADFAVQEHILKAIAKTDLVNCHLLAEEDTLTVKKFNSQNNFYLSIDPIDDTAIYARKEKHFSTIVSLHDGQKYIYTFVYFPAWNWLLKISNGTYKSDGKPEINLPVDLKNTILYWEGNPESHLPKEILENLRMRNVDFRKVRDVSLDFGSIGLFATNKVLGVYHEDMNAYDGMTEYVIASTKGCRIITSGIDLSDIQEREKGAHYKGYYLALNEVV